MPRPVHFEIVAEDPERAAVFYREVFGWDIKKWDGPAEYWLVSTGSKDEIGIDGGISRHTEAVAGGGANAFICTIGVTNFEEYHQKILDHGGNLVQPKHEIPGVGYHGDYKDTEGNYFSILEPAADM